VDVAQRLKSLGKVGEGLDPQLAVHAHRPEYTPDH
jgi:hypothetical protein